MAGTDPALPAAGRTATGGPEGPGATSEPGQGSGSGGEALSADLETSGPRVPTRVLSLLVLALVVVLLASGVVAFVLLHQPRLTPVPVPSVSSVA